MTDVVTNAALITQPCKGHPWPALHAAIESGQLEVVRLSLDWGSDPWFWKRRGGRHLWSLRRWGISRWLPSREF